MAARCVFATSIPVSTSSKACAPPSYLHQAFEVRGNEGQLAGGHHPDEYVRVAAVYTRHRHFMQPTSAVYRQRQGSRPGVRYGCWPTA